MPWPPADVPVLVILMWSPVGGRAGMRSAGRLGPCFPDLAARERALPPAVPGAESRRVSPGAPGAGSGRAPRVRGVGERPGCGERARVLRAVRPGLRSRSATCAADFGGGS
ncbi:hypothetical protein ACE1SV_49470 [Streptomyces sp. E-15]